MADDPTFEYQVSGNLNNGTNTGTFTGNFTSDYTTDLASGSVQVNTPDGNTTFTFTNANISNGAEDPNQFTLNAIGPNGETLGLTYTGQTPTSFDFGNYQATADISAEYSVVAPESIMSTDVTTCYVTGTLIRTARGDIAVEDLAVGDLVVTASGEERPIKWLGHRTLNCTRHPHPDTTYPIRVVAGAFGRGKPYRDLYVSPGHAVCATVLDDVFVHAGSLINGATIERVSVDEVTYWHVELDTHDVLIANGLPAESYMDLANRHFFAENGTVNLHGAPDGVPKTTDDFCLPLIMSGPILAALRERLEARAKAMGYVVPEVDFNEIAYLAVYSDVADAVKNGGFKTGYQHWMEYGKYEGRSPNPPMPRQTQSVEVLDANAGMAPEEKAA